MIEDKQPVSWVSKRDRLSLQGPLSLKAEVMDRFPNSGGIYILVTRKKPLVYPAGNSRILYIGRATKVRTRLDRHRAYVEQAKHRKQHKYPRYYRHYEYAAKSGCLVYWFKVPPSRIKNAERRTILSFAKAYLTAPIGNSQDPWE